MGRLIRAADLFAGAGGTSTGLARAAELSGSRVELVAINHWEVAVETHAKNHPWARHICAPLDALNPRQAVPCGKLDILVASPECTHHSSARGGRPMHDQSRASAWHVAHWAETLQPEFIIIENVPEFRGWGPLGRNGRPIASRKGETYAAWLQALRSLGYVIDDRILNAADFGDPTTRRRLFVIARRGRRGPTWPTRTHVRPGSAGLFDQQLPEWRTARDAVIDWTFRGSSIFDRKKPLAEATLRRIAEGLRRFGGEAAEPFLMLLTHGGRIRSMDEPLPTVTGANRGEIAMVEPFMVPHYGERPGQPPRTHSIDAPVPTLPATPKFTLIEPFILGQQSGGVPRGVSNPLPTVAGKGALALIEPMILSYYGNGGVRSTREPLPTMTTKDRFGLLTPTDRPIDILFRMLAPHELARAMGFPADYTFAGNRTDVVRQIGNAVAVGVATALCEAALGSRVRQEAA